MSVNQWKLEDRSGRRDEGNLVDQERMMKQSSQLGRSTFYSWAHTMGESQSSGEFFLFDKSGPSYQMRLIIFSINGEHPVAR